MSRIPKSYEIYKHFNGKLYQVLLVAEHYQTGEKLVVYQALYGNFIIYARPLDEFLDKVDKDKYPEAKQLFRFELQSVESSSENPEIMTNPNLQASERETQISEGSDIKIAEMERVKEISKEPNLNTSERTSLMESIMQAAEKAFGVKEEPEGEELNIDPMVLQFLDAETHEERLNILTGLKHWITDEMITTMAIASDVEVPEGSLEERFLELKNCLITRDKYERSRSR